MPEIFWTLRWDAKGYKPDPEVGCEVREDEVEGTLYILYTQ